MLSLLKRAARSLRGEKARAAATKKMFDGVVHSYAKNYVQPENTKEEIARLTERKRGLTGLESETGTAISERIAELKCADLDAKYPRLSLDFLKFKNTRGQPQFAVFGLHNSEASLTLDRGGVEQSVPFFHLHRFYAGFKMSWAAFHIGDKYRTKLSTHFNGTLPPEAREAIEKAKPDFPRNSDYRDTPRENIGVIASVDSWKEEKIRMADPLVVGFRGARAWLICSFDLTPAEDYILGTFTE